MSDLTSEDVKHVAKLAKLKLNPKEIDKFRKQLSKIINYIVELNNVDTSNTIPTSQTTGLENIFREDKVNQGDSFTQDEVLFGTNKVHNGYFLIPPILEK